MLKATDKTVLLVKLQLCFLHWLGQSRTGSLLELGFTKGFSFLHFCHLKELGLHATVVFGLLVVDCRAALQLNHILQH